jgi:hypothetical protein
MVGRPVVLELPQADHLPNDPPQCVEAVRFVDLAEARLRIAHYIDSYSFQLALQPNAIQSSNISGSGRNPRLREKLRRLLLVHNVDVNDPVLYQ